jgi:LPS-assembly protein
MKCIGISFLMMFPLLVLAQAGGPRDSAPAKIQGVIINADSSLRDSEKETIELQGHVQVVYGDQHLYAEYAVVNFRSKSVDARGNVTITSSKATIGGQRVTIDLETNTGVIYKGYVQSGTVSFEGEILYKISENEFIADDSKYTTCTNCEETWSFTGSKIRARLGGYAYIKNAVLRIAGVPVFPLPYLLVPLKSDRQSGVLTPEYEKSDTGGNTVAGSYFWAIDRSQDATFTLKNYELRGLKSLVNYRYAVSEHGYGSLDAGWLQDQAFASSSRLQTFVNQQDQLSYVNRWFLKYNHYQDLPDGFVHRAQFNNSADLQYPEDFPFETGNNGDPAMEDRMSISKSSDNTFLMVDSSYYYNLLQSNPLANNNDAVQRLPEVRATHALSRVGQSEFLYSWDLDMTNFARSSAYSFDTLNQAYTPGGSRYLAAKNINGNGTDCSGIAWEQNPSCAEAHNTNFDYSKDLIRTGQRVDGQFSIQRPFHLGPIDMVPRISYRDTDYNFVEGPQSTATRKYFRTELSSRTVFDKIYTVEKSDELIKHEFQPEIGFNSIPWLYQPAHPFFAGSANNAPFSVQDNISDTNLNSPYGLQFDYFDRNYDMEVVSLGFTNRLIRKVFENGHPVYRQFFSWKFAQSYDIFQAAGNPPYQPYSDIMSELNLTLKNLTIYQRLDYFPYQEVTNSSTRVRAIDNHGDFFQLGYDLSYNIVPGQQVLGQTRTEQYSFEVKKSLRLIDILGKIVFDVNPPLITPNQWINSYGVGTQLRLPGDCFYLKLILYRPTGGSDTYNFAFDFSFDGEKKPGLPESLLDTFSF